MAYQKGQSLIIIAALVFSSIIVFIVAFIPPKESGNVTTEIGLLISTDPLDTTLISSLRDSIESFGSEFLGVPYIYGGNGAEGFDCSGFVYHVFKNFSIDVPRSTSLYEGVGREISIDNVKKGDLLLFLSPTRDAIGHIGIVTNPKGMETEFIHASSGKEMQVIISSLKQPNYNRRFVRAVSVIED
jgi:hypothetical protein